MVANPHDLLFRSTFSIVEHAEGELRSFLPARLVSQIDWTALRVEPGTFVDPSQRELRTDLLYSVALAGRRAHIYLLFEHQSTVDPTMHLRLLEYMVRIWWSQHANGVWPLPAIVPLVLHHSVRGWTVSPRFSDLLDLPEDAREVVRRFVPDFELLVDDLGRTSERDLLQRRMSSLAKLVIWALRAVRVGFDSALVVHWAEEIARAAAGGPSETLRAMMRYLSEVDGGTPVLEALLSAPISENVEEVVMGLRHEWERQAEARGEARGEALGRAEIVLKLLRLRFGDLPSDAIERVRAANVSDLDRWAERVLTATTIDQVFGPFTK